jgi:hypothetical protein
VLNRQAGKHGRGNDCCTSIDIHLFDWVVHRQREPTFSSDVPVTMTS